MDGLPAQLPDLMRTYGERWQIRHDEEHDVWTALCRPSPASQRFIAAYDLPALAAKLHAAHQDDS